MRASADISDPMFPRSRRSGAGSTSVTCSDSCPTTTNTSSRISDSSSRLAYVSDRQFLEEYYKRLNETGMDQETVAYGQWQKDNWAWTLWAEANLQNFDTDTQWLPRLDYYRLGDSFLDHWFNYSQHTGVDYANVHTDIMVNNPNLFAFMPYDPISNTSGPFQSMRAYTNHEIDMPINISDVVRVMPYVQGQIEGWSNQIGGGPFNQQSTGPMARFWGAAGCTPR